MNNLLKYDSLRQTSMSNKDIDNNSSYNNYQRLSALNVFDYLNDEDELSLINLGLDRKTSQLILNLCAFNPINRPSSRELLDYIITYDYFLS